MLFFCCLQSKGQIIEIDSITNAINGEIPFDEAFYLQINLEPGFTVDYLTISKKRNYVSRKFTKNEIKHAKFFYGENNVSIKEETIERLKKAIDSLKKTKNSKILISKKKKAIDSLENTKNDSLLVNLSKKNLKYSKDKKTCLINIFPLPPNYNFNFYVISKKDKLDYTVKRREKVIAIKNSTIKTKDSVQKNIKKIVNDSITKLKGRKEKEFNPEGVQQEDIVSLNTLEKLILTEVYEKKIAEFKNEYSSKNNKNKGEYYSTVILKDSLKAKNSGLSDLILNKIDSLELDEKQILNSINDSIKIIPLHKFTLSYYETMGKLTLCDSCSVVNNRMLKNDSPFNFYKGKVEDVLLGKISLTDSNRKTKESLDLKARIKNLEKTYDFVELFTKNKLFDKTETDINFNEEVLKSINDRIKITTDFISKWEKIIKQVGDSDLALFDEELFKEENVSGSTNGAITPKTEGKFILRPDLGVSVVSNINGFSRIVPHIGVRFNLRPLNSENSYVLTKKKNFWHRSSIGVSFTTNSISDDTTRFDLFSNRNMIIDYGYRINNAMTVNLGGLFFLKKDIDPFVSDKKLTILPTLGISFDFGLLKTLKDVKDIIAGK